MFKVNRLAGALLLSLSAASLLPLSTAHAAVNGAEQCPMDARQSKAVGQSVGKKVQRSYKAYTEGDLDGALAILLEANAKNSFDKAYVARMLGNFYAEKGDMPQAIKYLQQAVEADILGGSDHAGTLRLYADLLMQEKHFAKAITNYYQWMDFSCKQDPKVYRRIGIAHSELKQWDKVIQVADKGISLSSEPDKGLYQMKLTSYYNLKQYKNSVKVLETMVPLFQDDKRLWVQLAQFYLLTEDMDKALATYDLSYKNGFLETASNVTRLSQLLAQKGAHYQAARIYEKEMKAGLIKEDEKTLSMLAGFYQNAKELTTAAKYFAKAAAIDNNADLYLKQGRLLAMSERYGQAIPVFKKALSAGLKNPGEAQFELALAYLSLKKYKSAYSNAKLASKDKKTSRSATSYLAYIENKAQLNNVRL